jgi:hypothetical protein
MILAEICCTDVIWKHTSYTPKIKGVLSKGNNIIKVDFVDPSQQNEH